MAKRTRKPPVKLEVRRGWLRQCEEEGVSAPQIAEKDGFDVRTVRKQIEMAKEEREYREARAAVLRNAVEGHYDDLRKFAEYLDAGISGATEVPAPADLDFLESALRQHLPRSPIWTLVSKRQSLQQKAEEQRHGLERAVEDLVKAEPALQPMIDAGLSEVVPGVVAVLVREADQWVRGNVAHTLRGSLVVEVAGEGLVNPRFGFSHMGAMKKTLADGFTASIRDALASLETRVRESKEYRDLDDTVSEIARLGSKLREELAVIRLRRILPGRCKYCPL